MENIESTSLPAYPQALVSFNDAMRFAASRESFEIKKTVLLENGKESGTVYLVALRGTDSSFDRNDVLGIPVVLKSSLSMNNIYYDIVRKTILETVPEGSSIVLIGHSLGGMIAQQIAADSDINSKFSLINLLTIGSPFVKVKGRSCPLRRFADKADIIPWLFRSLKANLITEKPVFKSNGYFGKPILAHTDSYRESDSWRVYDCFGVLNGGHVLVFEK